MPSPDRPSADRVTVTLGNGQKDALEAIAKENGTTVAFVVRYIITRFLQAPNDRQLQLSFPPPTGEQ